MNNTNFTLWGGLDLPYTLCGVVGMCPKPSLGWGGFVLSPLWGGLGLSLRAFCGVGWGGVVWVCLKPSVGWFGSVLSPLWAGLGLS